MASNRLIGPFSQRVLGARVYPLLDEGTAGLPADAFDGPGPVVRPYFPEHWPLVSAGVTEPDYLWTCQDASGNLLDLCNNPQAQLVAGLNVSYQQTVSGWASKFVGVTAEAANSGFYSPINTLWNPASQSVFALMYSAILVSTGARVLWLGGGTSPQVQIQAAAAGQATVFCGAGTTGTFVYENVTPTVYPFAYHYDRRGAGFAGLYTNKEGLTTTWNNVTDSNKGWGGPVASPQARHTLMAVWVGANAEAMMDRGGANLGGKTLIQQLGWPMAY